MFKQGFYGFIGCLAIVSFCAFVYIKTTGIIKIYDSTISEFQFETQIIVDVEKNCTDAAEFGAKLRKLAQVANDRKFDRAVIAKQQATIHILLIVFAFTSLSFMAYEIRRKLIELR